MHKLLTLNDLYLFYFNKDEDIKLSSQSDDIDIIVSVPGNICFSKQNKSDLDGLLPVTLQACHILDNSNNSYISKESMEKALPSFFNRPILGYIHEVDGVAQFYSHNMHINENSEIEYDEIPVGVIPESCNAKLVYDKEKKKTYCCVDGYIFEEYSKAAEIIERESQCPVSVELSIREMSYNAKTKKLYLEDFYFSGVTILGYDEDGNEIKPGMVGSNIKINNSALSDDIQNIKLIEALDRLNKNLEEFQINNAERKEEKHPMGKFEQLLKKYNKTEQDITFDYKGMSDEELETAFKKAFDDPDPSGQTEQPETPTGNDPPAGENNDPPADDSDPEPTEDDVAAAGAVTTAITGLSESITLEDAEDVAEAREAYNALTDIQKGLVTEATLGTLEAAEDAITNLRSADDKPVKKRKNNEVTFTAVVDGEIKEFAVSLIDKLNALRDLVNNTYSDSDDCWYDVDAYDEDKYVIMHDYWRNKHFRQSYAVRNDIYSLKGDRVEVFAQYLTQDEINSLSTMKSNYEQISNDLMQYQKKELIASNDYSAIATKEAFVKIADEVNAGKNEMSFEELKNTLDQALLDFAKSGNLDFEVIQQKEEANKKKGVRKIGLMASNKKNGIKKSRYGNLFK